MNIYLQIFWSFFQIGLFSIGGGYAALPLIKHQVLEVHNWLSLAEFSDLLTISQMTPGPIALNASTFVGTKVTGVLGGIIATIGCITPSCIIVLSLSYLYFKYKNLSSIQGILKGLRPAVVALISSAGLSILLSAVVKPEEFKFIDLRFSDINYISIAIIAIGVFVIRKYKMDPMKLMVASGIIGIVAYTL